MQSQADYSFYKTMSYIMLNKMIQDIMSIIYCFILLVSMNNTKVLAQQDSKGIRTIYLIRHGDYAPQDDSIPDSINVLTPLGIAQARLVSTRLKSMNYLFSLEFIES